ncbi:MAG: 4-(cytidine 5'-diphospho)-2-C-methyl-D-erythritol kinase, partial [Oscillospiraceae bacterium]
MLDSVSIKSYAKLNLYLEIKGKDSRNYHYLKTVMQSISLHDDLRFIVSDGEDINILCDKPEVPTDNKNLVWKAVEAFYDYTGLEKKSIDVMIKKQIPMMAGLAGGSSNAAAALQAMNRIYDNPLSTDQLCEIAGNLGSDIPFCVMGGTVLCEGFGEKLTALEPIAPCSFIVIKPEEGISTPQAYKDFDACDIAERPDFTVLENGLKNNNITEICSGLYNDLDVA